MNRLPHGGAFVVVSVMLATFFVASGAPSPLLPIYERQWGFAPWLITVAFGVYAISLLVALLVLGSLSDHFGRRPVIIGSLCLELASVVVFLLAPDIGWVVFARGLQGIATGAATSAFSAAVLELAPAGHSRTGTLVGSLSPLAGLGLGALFAGAVARFSPTPGLVVWGALGAILLIGSALALFTPETSGRQAGALQSLVPRIRVPGRVRGSFRRAVPTQVAAWMTAALFIGLAPTILSATFGVHDALESGATVFLEPGFAVVAVLTTGAVPPRRVVLVGASAVAVGAALVVAGVTLTVLPLLWLGGAIGGFGFGSSFTGSIRLLAPQVRDHERAALFAAIYTVAYGAFGVPAIIAGTLLQPAGLLAVAVAYGAVIVAMAVVGFVAEWSRSEHGEAGGHLPVT